MTSLFNVAKKWESNPSSTTVGRLIEQATDGSLASENWTLNMQICDAVNSSDETCRDAFKAIRKRLASAIQARNSVSVLYTLIVLETCVKNCGPKFHTLVCSQDFIMELVKLIGPKNEAPPPVQDKVLGLIQSWSDAFRGRLDCQGVTEVYRDLRAKGVEFPMTDLDAMAPIHTPNRSVGSGVGVEAPPVPAATGAVMLTGDQASKLRRELEVVETNASVLDEMLSEMRPGAERPADWELLQQLRAACKEMQTRLVELIPRVSNDLITADLLRINDTLNTLFLRYNRYEKKREAVQSGRVPPAGAEDTSLIDLTDGTTAGIADLSLGTQVSRVASVPAQVGSRDEFDALAHSRNQPPTVGSGSTYESNRQPDQVTGVSLGAMTEARAMGQQMHKESDFDEMAAWLGQSGAPQSLGGTIGAEESMTSSEFDRFLAERAAAAEATPSRPARPDPSASIQ